jgi:cation diffusion facilitator CzcD-associated flavoprotein CzcO
VVWTSTSILTIPKYDPESHVWSITITRANHDRPITLRPAHLVLATSTLGPPYTPSIPDLDIFTGFSIHSSAFHGPEPYAGKRVLMVGAANTACDLARILAPMAASVTLLQRNPTCLILPDVSHAYWSAQYPPGLALEEADFRNSSPPGLVRSRRTKAWREAVLVDGGELDVASPEDARRKAILHAGGFRTWFGAHGEGALGEILSRFAGVLK